MATSRNQLCPCGSRKKYKKCCMKKENTVQLNEVKENRFIEQKHVLTTEIMDFVFGQMTSKEIENLFKSFDRRTKGNVNKDAQQFMYQFFTLFCHRFENGLRGVEWFYLVEERRLKKDIKALAKAWTNLQFRLVNAVERTEETTVFEDIFTKQTFPVANGQGNVPKQQHLPFGTIGLLEKNNGMYYFNGVKVFSGFRNVAQARNEIEALMKETSLSYEQVLMDYTPEIFGAFLDETKKDNFTDEDKPILEELKLNHLPDYAEDFLSFFKEKSAGKKEKTIKRYRVSLIDLNELLKKNHYFSLAEIDERSWRKLITTDYFNMFKVMTKTQIVDLISTLRAFEKWMHSQTKGDLVSGLSKFIKEEESQLVNAVQLMNSFFPNRHGGIGIQFYESIKLIKGEVSLDSPSAEGRFEIIRVNIQSFRVAKMNPRSEKMKEYTVSTNELNMENVETGLILDGKILKGKINMWEMVRLDKVYSQAAKDFL